MGLMGWRTMERPAAKKSRDVTVGSMALWFTRICSIAGRGRVP